MIRKSKVQLHVIKVATNKAIIDICSNDVAAKEGNEKNIFFQLESPVNVFLDPLAVFFFFFFSFSRNWKSGIWNQNHDPMPSKDSGDQSEQVWTD